jgi:diguanylate cyclase (GGDEF)-like protein
MAQTRNLTSRKERIREVKNRKAAESRKAAAELRKVRSELHLFILLQFIVLVVVFLYMAFTITIHPLNYLWVVVFLMITIIGFLRGVMVALISSMFAIFGYGSMILYELYIAQTTAAMNVNDIVWLVFFPAGAFASGLFGRRMDDLLKYWHQLRNMAEEHVTVERVTGFPNERQFRADLNIEISRSLRYKHSMTVLLMEIAYFPELVRGYGQEAADELLRRISGQIEAVLRDVDKKAYLGNGLFGFVLPETGIENADIVIRRLHDRVKTCRIDSGKGEKQIDIQLRYGYSGCPQTYQTAHELLEDANRMLSLYAS